ncbi:MAG: GNAT family N-acetyltransferase [Proteobacteria bacterium]|nr:GNAT family N-acetyltransferase [Pseudomonadota bacterium]
MPIHIRPATDADDARCGEIIASANGELAERVPHARAVLEDGSPLPRDGRERLIAEVEGKAVGFVDFEPDGYIKYLFVAQRHHRRGAGSALLAAAERAIGAPTYLSVFAVNDRALRFYMERGYRIVGGEVEEDWHGGPVVRIELRNDAPG